MSTALLLPAGCAHKRPYGPGQGPAEADLLGLARPQIHALQVPKAKVVLNRALRGNMAFIAESPGRFRGGVEFAGNELVTLAFHEQGYALRYKLDMFPTGFYEGPPDDCAVQALLGISIDTEALVSLMLGGAPLIAAPFEVVSQKWSRKKGWEALVIRNDRYVEELRFEWSGSQWQFVGGQLWARNGKETGQRLWEVQHKSLKKHGDVVLPDRTLVSTPTNKRRDDLVTIIYKERNLDPAFAKGRSDGGDGGEDGGDDGAAEGGDDGWDDGGDDGWEEDDEWEDDPPATPAAGAAAQEAQGEAAEGAAAEGAAAEGEAAEGDTAGDEGDAPAEPAPPESEPAPTEAAPPKKDEGPAKPPAKKDVPEVFKLIPGNLKVQGDLCHRAP